MGRYSYDDMPPEGYRERKGSTSRMTLVIALIGIIITMLAIVLYLLFNTPADGNTADVSADDARSIEVQSPEVLQLTEKAEAQPREYIEATPIIEKASSDFSPVQYAAYTVAEGDTLQSIAEKHGIDKETIASVNELTDTEIAPGTELRIPDVSGILVTVEEGDTLLSIVRKRNPELSAADLAAINRHPDTFVTAGEKIFVPNPGALERPVSRTFSSPIPEGRVVAHYKEYYNGILIPGVLIASEPGSAVHAAADGSVIDKSFDRELGRTIKILHADGYVTVYSSLETVVSGINVGMNISRGEVIGSIGTSSVFSEPSLLFSLEQNSVSLDPELLTEF